MKIQATTKITRAFLVALILVSCVSAKSLTNTTVPTIDASQPASFVENSGQWNETVLFKSHTREFVRVLYENGIGIMTMRRIDRPSRLYELPQMEGIDPGDRRFERQPLLEISGSKMEFVGANPAVKVKGLDIDDGYDNYLLGNDRSRWTVKVPRYSRVQYEDIYPNIDLIVAMERDSTTLTFEVHRGGDISAIRIRSIGSASPISRTPSAIELSRDRQLVGVGSKFLRTGTTTSEAQAKARLKLNESSEIEISGLGTGEQTAPTNLTLAVVYSSFVGGTREDWGFDVAHGPSVGSLPPYLHVVGHTLSADFPTDGIYSPYKDTIDGKYDIFLTKYDPSGKAPVFRTYFGGSGDDWGYAVAVDASGGIVFTGATSSEDFPLASAYDGKRDGRMDGFVAKLSDDGTNLLFSTYLGGSSYDVCNDVALDGSAQPHVTGMTYSTDFPTTDPAYQERWGGYWDAFFTRLQSDGSDLSYSTYLGGSNLDAGYGIAVDGLESAYITGITWSADYHVTPGAAEESILGPQDAFITKLAPNGNVEFSTFAGGSGREYALDIAIDSTYYPYITGWTESADLAANGSYDATLSGLSDAFLIKLGPDGSAYEYVSYLGGSDRDAGYGIDVNGTNSAFVSGRTESTDFPNTGDISYAHSGASDAFMAKFSPQADALEYSSCLGGQADDWGYGLTVHDFLLSIGQIVAVTGKSGSDSLPGSFPGINPNSGNYDAFLAMLLLGDVELPTAVIDSVIPETTTAGTDVRFEGHGVHNQLNYDIVGYEWESDLDGVLSSDSLFTTSSLSIGNHSVHFRVHSDLGFWSLDTQITVVIMDTLVDPPVAVIDSIVPAVISQGQSVCMGGHGEDPPSDSIEGYRWESNIDGFLTSSKEFCTSSLSLGNHEISFSVRDDSNIWSSPVTRGIQVTEAADELWDISWWFPDFPGLFDLLMHDNYACTLIVTNISQTDQVFEYGLAKSGDRRTWANLPDAAYWSVDELNHISLNGGSYTFGNIHADVIASGETRRYVFDMRNDWDWIPAWQLTNYLSLISSLAGPIVGPAGNYVEAAYYLQAITDFSIAPIFIKYDYTYLGDAGLFESGKTVNVFVRGGKLGHYWISVFFGFVASRFTQAGYFFLATVPPAAGPIIAAAFFVAEALYVVAGELGYQAALDPDQNYTTYVNPPAKDAIPASPIVDSLEKGCWKRIDELALDAYAFADAGLATYGKFVGAVQDSSIEWSTKHLATTYCYMRRGNSLVTEINEIACTFTEHVALPDSSDVEEIKDSIAASGMPEIEDEVFDSLNFDQTGLETWFYDAYDSANWQEFSSSFSRMTDTAAILAQSTKNIVSSLVARALNGAVIGEVVQLSPDIVTSTYSSLCTLWVEFPGLIAPLPDYEFNAMTVNDAGGSPVYQPQPPQTFDIDNDTIPEIMIVFSPVVPASGYGLQSIFGQLVTPAEDTVHLDTLPFSAAEVLEVVDESIPTRLCGNVMQPFDFGPIPDINVSVYLDPQLFSLVDIDTSDSAGRYCFALPENSYYLKFDGDGYADTSTGPVRVSPHDTMRVCMLMEEYTSCCEQRGNVNGVGAIDISDLTYLVRYQFSGGAEPPCMEEADVDGSGVINISDLTYLVAYSFKDGPLPVPCP